MLTREQIFSSSLKSETVAVPDWGGDVVVRALTARERDARELAFSKQREETETIDNVRARTVAMALVGEDGKRLLADPFKAPEAFEKDVELLGDKDGGELDRLYDVVCRLSKLTSEAAEETEKNSASDRNGSSSSG